MSAILSRGASNFLRRSSLCRITNVRTDKLMPDPIEHATGLEKKELLARAAGNDDPFNMHVRKRGKGTKTEPNLVPSVFDKRLIGCICEEDATVINWMWLYKGENKRCECGHWFKLTEAKPI